MAVKCLIRKSFSVAEFISTKYASWRLQKYCEKIEIFSLNNFSCVYNVYDYVDKFYLY